MARRRGRHRRVEPGAIAGATALVWCTDRRQSLACLWLEAAQSALLPAVALVAQWALPRAVETAERTEEVNPWPYLAGLALVVGLLIAARQRQRARHFALFIRVRHAISELLTRVKTAAPVDVSETPLFRERVTRASDAEGFAYSLASGMPGLPIRLLADLATVAFVAVRAPSLGAAVLAVGAAVALSARGGARALRRSQQATVRPEAEIEAARRIPDAREHALELRTGRGGRYLSEYRAGQRARISLRLDAYLREDRLGAALMGAVIAAGLLAVAWVLLRMRAQGQLSGSEATLIGVLLAGLAVRGGTLGMTLGQLQQVAGPLRELRRLRAEFLSPRARPPAPVESTPVRASGLTADALVVRYPGAVAPVIVAASLEARPGEVVVVVGKNGAGKSTLLRALAGERRPDELRVAVGGVDVYGFAGPRARATIGFVPQGIARFPGTVAQVIALEAQPDLARVRAAAAAVGAAGFVEGLPDGYETSLRSGSGEGAELSGGQWQLLALARQRYGPVPPIALLLDEPTASLDPPARRRFVGMLRAAFPETAIVVSTHDGLVAERADRVYVLACGRIVESGSPAELVGSGGRFAALVGGAANA